MYVDISVNFNSLGINFIEYIMKYLMIRIEYRDIFRSNTDWCVLLIIVRLNRVSIKVDQNKSKQQITNLFLV